MLDGVRDVIVKGVAQLTAALGDLDLAPELSEPLLFIAVYLLRDVERKISAKITCTKVSSFADLPFNVAAFTLSPSSLRASLSPCLPPCFPPSLPPSFPPSLPPLSLSLSLSHCTSNLLPLLSALFVCQKCP